jgi:hypothetical protein
MTLRNSITGMPIDEPGIMRSCRAEIWIQSRWPVKSPGGAVTPTTAGLSACLAEGLSAQRDPKGSGFFEASSMAYWFYFHVADDLRCIYLIAARKAKL